MAEKQFALSGSRKSEFFADDDPLAELARIVGFEPQPTPQKAQTQASPQREPVVILPEPAGEADKQHLVPEPAAEFPPEPVADVPAQHVIAHPAMTTGREPVMEARPSPALDLEDELLREFELYDAPRVDRVPDVAAPEPVVSEPQFSDTDIGGGEASPVLPMEPETVDVALDQDFDAMFAGEDLSVAAPAVGEEQSGENDAGPAGYEELEALTDLPEWPSPVPDADGTPAAAEPEHSDLADELEQSIVSVASDPVAHVLPVNVAPVIEHAEASAPSAGVESGLSSPVESDLADELMQSIAEPAVLPDPAIEGMADFPAKSAATEQRFRLPLANFNTPRVNFRAAPKSEQEPETRDAQAAIAQPADMGFQPEHDRHEAATVEFDTLAGEQIASPVPEFEAPHLEAAVASPDQFPSAVATDRADNIAGDRPRFEPVGVSADKIEAFNLDDLMADVARYPVPGDGKVSPAAMDVQSEPRFGGGKAVEQTAFTPEPALAAARKPEGIAQAAEPAFDDPFAVQDFEFDLDDIELELADMTFDEPRPQAPAATDEKAPAPARGGEAAPAERTASLANPVFASAFEPSLSKGQPSLSERTRAQPAGGGLPFDPALIAEAEDHPESIADMHVPSLPVAEPDEPMAVQPEYDIDIDAEMANLFNHSGPTGPAQAISPGTEEAVSPERQWARQPVARQVQENRTQNAVDEFDEFERALEEDFRRSLTEPMGTDNGGSRMALEPDDHVAARQKRRPPRRLLIAASLAALAAVGGGGAYALFGGGDASLLSGGPRVITADSEPAKVVPEDRGGRTVPNQDKAVYDRVDGSQANAPRQGALLSSNEEPVDVVQKTLIPESLPLEGREDVANGTPTAVGETEDSRLLPDGATADRAAGDKAKPAGVSPRKVRTMIVKPDGTLVAREIPAPANDGEAAAAAAVNDGALNAAARSVQLAEPTVTAEKQPAGNVADTPADKAAASDIAQPQKTASGESQPEVANGGAANTPPVRVVKTTKFADRAPVPETRPVDQPVNVVGTVTDKGNIRPTTQADGTARQPAERQTEVASAASGGYAIQVASLPSEAEAKKSYASLSSKFGGIIGGRGVDIRKVDVPGKGTFYRVRIPAGSKDEAAALCVKLRAAGGTCLISK